MPTTKFRRSLLGFGFAVSLAFNTLWMAGADDLIRLTRVSHFAEVHADAVKAADAEDWLRAAQLYAYLRDYHPEDCRTCPRADATVAWMLPIWAISSTWNLPNDESTRQRLLNLDREQFRGSYLDAMRKAGIDKERIASLR